MTSSGTAQGTWDALPPADRFAWLTFRKAAVELLAVLDADLQEHVQIGFTDFDALIRLFNAPERTMRMADLARAVSRSPSALTRMVNRLEARRVVTRNRHTATEVTVTLTAKGLTLLDEAAPRHLDLVRHLFWAPLTPAQRTQLGSLCQRLIEAECTTPPGGRTHEPVRDTDLVLTHRPVTESENRRPPTNDRSNPPSLDRLPANRPWGAP